MNPQDLKTGHEYLIRAKFDHKDYDNDYNFIADPSEYRIFLDEKSVRQSVIETLEPPTSAGAYPKFRLFRKGDKVRVVEWNGRNYYDQDHHTELKTGCLAEIWDDERDEQEEGYVSVIYEEYIRFVPPCYLELVTPVEELKPYEVTESTDYFAVENRATGDEVATFWKEGHPNPKEAAEAECARLNAEFRKEQN
jgi:hypothetical protein